ncbi:MAG: DUF4974 domain-containing protein [Deltaproteobacteria bacterium]|nr:DUF4974 domain-containing protein [Deltaproteobacteria bacterium]
MKKNKQLYLIIMVHTLLLCAFLPGLGFASTDSTDKTYSFRFENCTISEALREISQKSGITIIVKSEINKIIKGKSYTDKTLDKILTDLLRGESSAVVWNYSNGSLASIGLYTFEKDSRAVNMRFIPDIPPSPVREQGPETRDISEAGPVFPDAEDPNADDEMQIALRHALLERERMRFENDENFPVPPGRGRSRRGVNAPPGSAYNPGSEEAAGYGAGEEANADAQDMPPVLPEEAEALFLPEAPDPYDFFGLEPPPMPPGMDL